jgi:hypothetical protein
MRNHAGILSLFAVAAGAWAAADTAWQSKNFGDWTDKDAQAIMTDSPWAKQIPMPASARPSVTVMEPGGVASPPSASLGNPSNGTTGANMSNPAIGGSNGPADANGLHNQPGAPTAPTPSGVSRNTGAPAPASVVTIIWASATPVRLAVLKLRSGANKPTEEQIAHASTERSNYVIAVVGLPAPEGGSDPKALAQTAYLHSKGKEPVRAIDSDYRRIGNSDVYFFRFARASLPITTADREIEFKMEMGQIEVKRKFDLGEMRYKGELAL